MVSEPSWTESARGLFQNYTTYDDHDLECITEVHRTPSGNRLLTEALEIEMSVEWCVSQPDRVAHQLFSHTERYPARYRQI
ncbi:hypothetical protein ElyMa_004957800 [Elysia marginata]|uniref:PRELI/MSF1 domain-containing protein n=1 Tax=Elysia marginata TaxID=1093978 RepID=A0AAV4J113_9GAST|nr:hypothetical protein ElyMa_004957800 [Elysia marginata]